MSNQIEQKKNMWFIFPTRILLFLSFFVGCLSLSLGVQVAGAKKPAKQYKGKTKKADLYLFPVCCDSTHCEIEGWVVRQTKFLSFRKKKSYFRSAMRAIRRLTRKGLAKAIVEVTFNGETKRVISDKYGFFSAHFTGLSLSQLGHRKIFTRWEPRDDARQKSNTKSTQRTQPTTKPTAKSTKTGIRWASARLIQAFGRWPFRRRYVALPTRGAIILPTGQKGLSVISDIDDTLIASYVKNKLKLVKTFLFKRFDQVKIFANSQNFLRLLLKSPKGRGGGTMHYVTGSPAIIYDRLFRLFRLRHFPLGSMHMKRLRGKKAHGALKHLAYKVAHLKRIIKMYPKRRFVLIGDSGEKDPEAYAAIRKLYPKNIAGVYIHLVTKEWTKSPRFADMFVFRNYAKAIQHARVHGLIR